MIIMRSTKHIRRWYDRTVRNSSAVYYTQLWSKQTQPDSPKHYVPLSYIDMKYALNSVFEKSLYSACTDTHTNTQNTR